MRRLLRLLVLAALAVWAWRSFFGARKPPERATASYADGSSIVLAPDSDAFDKLAASARRAIRG
jgi:hypothetical protein